MKTKTVGDTKAHTYQVTALSAVCVSVANICWAVANRKTEELEINTANLMTEKDYWCWGHDELVERVTLLEALVTEADTLLEPRTDVHADWWREQVDRHDIIRRSKL